MLRTTVIVRDISARVAAEQALERSEAAYRALFEEHHSPSLLIDPADGRIVDANAAALRFYGWSVDELTHKRIQEINTLTEAETRHEMARAARRGQNWFRFQHRLASGEVKDVDVYAGPVTLGERTLLLSLVHDQTPLHVVQASLTRMNKLHAMLSETNQAMLRSTNRDALVQQCPARTACRAGMSRHPRA